MPPDGGKIMALFGALSGRASRRRSAVFPVPGRTCPVARRVWQDIFGVCPVSYKSSLKFNDRKIYSSCRYLARFLLNNRVPVAKLCPAAADAEAAVAGCAFACRFRALFRATRAAYDGRHCPGDG